MKKTSILLNSCYLLSLLDEIFRLIDENDSEPDHEESLLLYSHHIMLYLRLLDWKRFELRTDPKLYNKLC